MCSAAPCLAWQLSREHHQTPHSFSRRPAVRRRCLGQYSCQSCRTCQRRNSWQSTSACRGSWAIAASNRPRRTATAPLPAAISAAAQWAGTPLQTHQGPCKSSWSRAGRSGGRAMASRMWCRTPILALLPPGRSCSQCRPEQCWSCGWEAISCTSQNTTGGFPATSPNLTPVSMSILYRTHVDISKR